MTRVSGCVLTIGLIGLGGGAWGQGRVIGSVPVSEASTTGALAVSGNKSLLGGASVVTALDRTAHVSLYRGGEVLVCQTSVAHLTSGGAGLGNDDPMLVSLDRGAMEVRTKISRDDALMTADLRFTSADGRDKPGALDLAVRVAANGDTCVDNRGKKGPALRITESFGDGTYVLKAGQHVLFEHGSLKEVVDTETSSCGCPAAEGMSLAEAAVRGGAGKKAQTAKESYPFPAAQSEGLVPPSATPAEKPGETHVQVAGTLTYDSTNPATDAPAAPTGVRPEMQAAAEKTAPLKAVSAKAGDNEEKHGPVRSIGRFFKRIFAR